MSRSVRLLAVLAIALPASLLAPAAFAQPGSEPAPGDPLRQPGTVVLVPGPPPPPGTPVQVASVAPQNEDWHNVSHINGQVVKVGERGDYLYRWKTTNIASNPIGWMFGLYGLAISHAVHDNVALRGDVNFVSFNHESGYEIGLSAPIYFRRVFSGPFLEPGVLVRGSSSCPDCGDHPASVGPEVLVGWHWTFDSGFNVAFAGGAMRNLNSKSGSGAEPAGYFRIGYAF